MASEAQRFLGIHTDANATARCPAKVPVWKRSLIVWSTFLVALISACPAPLSNLGKTSEMGHAIALVLFFPFGLAAICQFPHNETSALAFWWLLYLVLGVIALTATTRRRFYIFYGILFLIFLVNVGGCRMMWRDMSNLAQGWRPIIMDYRPSDGRTNGNEEKDQIIPNQGLVRIAASAG